jgi:hypothetical protein
MRATFIPAVISDSMASGVDVAGPSVATMVVRKLKGCSCSPGLFVLHTLVDDFGVEIHETHDQAVVFGMTLDQ